MKSLILITITILLFNGCTTYDILKMGNINKQNKTIIVPNESLSIMEIKRMLIKNGWKLKASNSGTKSMGNLSDNLNIHTQTYYKARYRMEVYETNRMEEWVLTIKISIIDNETQEEVLLLFGDSKGIGGIFPSETAKKLETALKEIEQ